MFTGIIEELGKIQGVNLGVNLGKSQGRLTVGCVSVLNGTNLGDSIAVNGVCLTVVEILPKAFVADISPETLSVTSLCNLQIGDFVNLERAMMADGRFGGHIVTGHVDGLGKIISIVRNDEFYNIKIELNEEQAKYVVKKGSVAIDGISLTTAFIASNIISLAIIPHTYENTNLKYLKIGDKVNIENDIMAKYVEKFLLSRDNESRISLEFLQENGF